MVDDLDGSSAPLTRLEGAGCPELVDFEVRLGSPGEGLRIEGVVLVRFVDLAHGLVEHGPRLGRTTHEAAALARVALEGVRLDGLEDRSLDDQVARDPRFDGGSRHFPAVSS